LAFRVYLRITQVMNKRESLVSDLYGLKTEKEFVNTLEDTIRKQGAMDKLISDCAKAESSNRVKKYSTRYALVPGIVSPTIRIKTLL
jgi:hypothetical protein